MWSATFTVALALVGSVQAGMDAWHADYILPLVNERLDPIVNPNGVATHMHNIIGGSAMGAAYDHETYANAKCSSIYNQADKSNYWVPQLYWFDSALGSKPYIPIRSQMRFYYFLGRNSPAQPVQSFPKGLRILAGDASNSAPSFKFAYICQTSPSLSGGIVSNNFNFDRNCPNGIKSVLYFPQCWDGLNLWLPDSAHMSYPVDPNNFRAGACPLSHPVRLPYIQLEVGWYPEEVAPGQATKGKLTWANGDSSGYAFHGDFVNGWDVDVLTKALNHPACLIGDEQAMETCPVFQPYWNGDAAINCKPERGVMQEVYGNNVRVAIPYLPGNNAPPGMPKSTDSPVNVSPFLGTMGATQVPANEAQNFVWPTAPGWKSIGCLRAMESVQNMTNIADTGLTPQRCQAVCGAQGQNLAGVGFRYGSNAATCVCGSSISPSATVYPLMCNSTCPGNSSATCGGADAWDFYYAPAGTSLVNPNSTMLGCLTNSGAGLREQATYSFSSGTMTTEVCKQACVDRKATWALTTNGRNCYCGTNYNLGKDTYVPPESCSTPCSGNASEVCGFTYRSNVYNLTAAAIAPQASNKPAGWQGCYSKPSSGAALSNSTWTSTSMTVANCVNGCFTLGTKYAALTGGSTCQCGDTTNLGAVLPSSQCTSACSGNSTTTCGGSLQVELYATNASTVSTAAIFSKYPAGYDGCYAHSTSSPALKDYSYTSTSMTVELCKTACASFGYTSAGMTNALGCSCGKTAPTTTKVSYSNCNMACRGNSSEFCGASNFMDVYTLKVNTTTPISGSSSGYQGCYQNYGGGGLPSYTWKHSAMTTEMCRTGCASLNYTMAGTENANQCRCGTKWLGGAVLPDSSCSSVCTGNSTQKCGAPSITSVYLTAGALPIVPRAAGYTGCFTDVSSARSLPAYFFRGTMTVDICRKSCAQKGYTLAGLENGNECYCDNKMVTPTPAPVTICNSACSADSSSLCGGPGVLDVYTAVAATNTSTNGTMSGSGSLGCFSDWGTTNAYNFASDMLTNEMCTQVCIAKKYKYAAIRSGNLCQCGNTPPVTLTTSSTCSSPCVGNKQQFCGSSNTVTAFDLSKVPDTSGNIIAPPDSKGFMGCFVNKAGPVLDVSLFASASMTNALCATSCTEVGYTLSGTYSSKYCYCGKSLNSTTADYQVSPATCNSNCVGNSTDKCGGSYLLSVYTAAKLISASNIPPATKQEGLKGCYAVNSMVSAAQYTYSDGSMSTSLCRRICRNKNLVVSALFDGKTCACANHNLYGALQPSASCTSNCVGNSTEKCGSSTTVSVFDVTGPGSLPPAGYPTNYVGCANSKDASGNPTLNGYTYQSAAMTPDMCGAICKGKGFSTYGLGLSSGKACYCGSTFPATWYQDSACSWACSGDPSQKCGNSYLFSIYKDPSVSGVARIASVPESNSTVAVNATSASASASSSALKSASLANSTSVANGTTVANSTSAANLTAVAKSTSAANSTSVFASASVANITAVVSASASASASNSSSVSKSVTAASTTSSSITTGVKPSTLAASGSGSSSSFSASSSAAASSSSSVSASSSSSALSPAMSAPSTDPTYLGCWTLPTAPTQFNWSLPINSTALAPTALTPDSCRTYCKGKQFKFASITNGTLCGCSNDIQTLQPAAKLCKVPCVGSPPSASVMCGSDAALTGPLAYGVWKSDISVVLKRHRRRFAVRHNHEGAIRL